MESRNNQSGSRISRRTALSVIGTVGSLGLAGCSQLSGFLKESSAIKVMNNATSNTASVKVVSKNGSVLVDEKYGLKSNTTQATAYTGNASKVIVSINGGKTKTMSVASTFSACRIERIAVDIKENGNFYIYPVCINPIKDEKTNSSA